MGCALPPPHCEKDPGGGRPRPTNEEPDTGAGPHPPPRDAHEGALLDEELGLARSIPQVCCMDARNDIITKKRTITFSSMRLGLDLLPEARPVPWGIGGLCTIGVPVTHKPKTQV